MIARPEHPKPQFERENWRNLNGEWDFCFDDGGSGLARGLEKSNVCRTKKASSMKSAQKYQTGYN